MIERSRGHICPVCRRKAKWICTDYNDKKKEYTHSFKCKCGKNFNKKGRKNEKSS